eukprot:1137477-Pelagomonas_calceolata.AAC.1
MAPWTISQSDAVLLFFCASWSNTSSRRLTASLFMNAHETMKEKESANPQPESGSIQQVAKNVMGMIQVHVLRHCIRRVDCMCISDRECIPLMIKKLIYPDHSKPASSTSSSSEEEEESSSSSHHVFCSRQGTS